MVLFHSKLLEKCLHGQTQNANDAFNQFIWKKIPKAVFVGRSVLEIGVYSALIEFNDGAGGVTKVLSLLGVQSGRFAEYATPQINADRIKNYVKKSSDAGKQRRKTLRAIKKGYSDQQKDLPLYKGS